VGLRGNTISKLPQYLGIFNMAKDENKKAFSRKSFVNDVNEYISNGSTKFESCERGTAKVDQMKIILDLAKYYFEKEGRKYDQK